jgi:hypothetical protein
MSSANALRQPTQRHPLLSSLVDRVGVLGVIGLRTRITLHLEASQGLKPIAFSFAVDSGASYSLIGLEEALFCDLPVPPPEAEIDLHLLTARGTTPVRVRPGRVRAWWDARCRGYPFDWPVLFRVGSPFGLPSILGLGGVVKTCRWTFDGSYSLDAPYGSLTLEDIR